MPASRFVPDRGDAIWITLDPQAGREQAGRRPALVLSPNEYNRKRGLMICCPIASRVKGFPFEVPIPVGLPVAGVVLADHVKSLDWDARDASFLCQVPDAVVERVSALLKSVI